MAAQYTTNRGDQWDAIALKIYGSELHADWLMQNNFKYLDIYEFDYGVILNTPPLPTVQNSNMPTWRLS